MSKNKIEIYESTDKLIKVDVSFDADTVWLNLNQMSQLFDRDKSVISRHLKNIFKEELVKEVVVAKNAHTTQHGAIKGKTQTKEVEYFNLDVIISLGYRVKSKQGTQFRIWATQRLKDYLIQGYAINEKRTQESTCSSARNTISQYCQRNRN